MSNIASLTLALGVLNQNGVRVLSVNKSNPSHCHIYYRMNGVNRVMVVPKECKDTFKLHREVESLVRRTPQEQQKLGFLDGKPQ